MTLLSPFTGFENADIYFPTDTAFTTNPDTGNQENIPVLTKFKALLMPLHGSDLLRYPGIDNTKIEIRGYLVSPMDYPFNMAMPLKVRTVIYDRYLKIDGTLELRINPDPFRVGDITGQRLFGTFIANIES